MIGLLSCGYHYVHPKGITIDRPSGAGNYAFVFFKSNSEVIVDGKLLAAEKNSYILFGPATRHLYRDVEKPFVNDWFHMEGSEIQGFLERLNFPMNTPVKAVDPLLITRCVMELQSINRLGGPLQNEIIDSEIRNLFMKLSNLLVRPANNNKASRYFRQFSELRNELYSSPQTHLSVEMIASRMKMSKSYFQHTYKELFGCSVIHDIINSRLEYAKYLLENSTLSVATISGMCGYDNETHFMRQFKKFIGVTPSHYKSGH